MQGNGQAAILKQTIAWCAVMLSTMLGAPIAYSQRYPFFNVGIEQGLIQSQVFAVTQDASGHLWAATLGGLSCYDGKTFRSFTVRDGLPSNTISALTTDKQDQLWVGTTRGLSRYDGHHFFNYTFTGPDNPTGNAVRQIAASADGIIWCIAGKALYKITDGKVLAVALPNGYPAPSAIHSPPDAAGLYVSLPGAAALYHFANGRWDSVALPKPTFIGRIYENEAHRLILLGAIGVYEETADGVWNPLIKRASKEDPLPYSFAQDRDGSYWVSTSNGVVQLRNGTEQWFSKAQGFTDVLIYDIKRDREGNLWFASNGEGLFRFSGAMFTAVDERMGLTGPQVSSIAQDGAGNIYFGSFDGGLYKYKDGKVSGIPFPGLRMRSPVTSLALRGNILWVATQFAGLWQYDMRTARMQRYKEERLETEYRDMISDSNGLWLANSHNITFIKGDSVKLFPLKARTLEAFTRLGADSLLLATGDGLMMFSQGRIRPFVTHTAADSAQIVCLDYRAGSIWVGTVDNGVFGYNIHNGSSIHIDRSNGLQSDFIYSIYAAPDGYVWAGTGYGICRIRPTPRRPVVTFFGRSAGLVGMESNRNAVYPLQDGSIWFGTTGGAVLYHPDQSVAEAKPVSLQLQRVLLFGDAIRDTAYYTGTSPFYGLPQDLRLPWRQNNLSFTFNAISLSGGETVKYRYRLEGLPAPWSEWSNTNTVNFSALPPGHYELLVECSTDGQKPQAASLRYPFEVITPFHKTGLFRLLVILACIILGVALQYLAARRKRKRQAQLAAIRIEEQARVRQRTAEDFHDEVGNKLTRINVLTNVLRSKVGATPDAKRLIDQIQDNAGQLYSGTRDILWSLQPSNDNLYQVMHRIRDFGRDLFGDTDTHFEMEDIPASWRERRLPMDASRNLIMIFKEALNNVLKYAGATRVIIATLMQEDELTLILHDNGDGFDCSAASQGQGINNMKTRAARLGGSIDIESAARKGTSVTLRLKIPQTRALIKR